MFKCFFPWLALCVACASAAQVKVQAQLPQRDFTIELRQVVEGARAEGPEAAVYSAGGTETALAWPPVSLVVRNGEKGVLRMQQSVPMQWVQSVQSQSGAPGGAAAAGSGGGPSVTQALLWFDVGQRVTVTPRWAGGKKKVTLELEVQQADMQTASHADLPRQVRNQTNTTVAVAPDEWTTIAASGSAPAPPGSYSSEARVGLRRLLQVRLRVF